MISEKYSNKIFNGKSFVDSDDMSNIEINNSSFASESFNVTIFPSNMTGTTFVDCNLDNVFVPSGNTIQGGTRVFYKTLDDGFEWNCDPETLQPTTRR